MRRSNSFRALAAIAGLSATMTLASCSSGGGGGDDKVTGKLNGAGASFPAAIYQRWFQELQPEGVTVNYQSVGSGAGVRQFTANTVDFGASDKPMKEAEIAKVDRGVLQIPMTAGAIAVAYNLEGCDLKLSTEQLAGIFLGKIKNFSELGCADQKLTVVRRSDGSGTLTTSPSTCPPSAMSGRTALAPPNPSSGPRALARRAMKVSLPS